MSSTTTGTPTGEPATEETSQLIASDKVEGTAVYNRNGDRLGSVYNFMVNKRSGQVAYAVLSFGGFLGMGEKRFAIPFEALKLDATREHFTLDVDKDKLKNAPGFDKNHPPQASDRTWGAEVYKFYAIKPYWQ